MPAGIAVKCHLQHATPAAFYAHVPDRGDEKAITRDLLASNIDLKLVLLTYPPLSAFIVSVFFAIFYLYERYCSGCFAVCQWEIGADHRICHFSMPLILTVLSRHVRLWQ